MIGSQQGKQSFLFFLSFIEIECPEKLQLPVRVGIGIGNYLHQHGERNGCPGSPDNIFSGGIVPVIIH